MMKSAQITQSTVGIDDMAIYVPRTYFDIKDLAKARNLEYEKLNKGLGLTYMAIADTHEDAATMAANAVAELMDKNNLNPRQIGRIYLGTESALDGAKPTATYALEMLQQRYAPTFGADCFRNCDVVDMTFACIGGVDALQNTMDWVRHDSSRIGIVVSSDNAKYELGSTGEYTQGAGAIAILVKNNPRLLAIQDTWGVATLGVHDFYKPLRTVSKEGIIAEVLHLAGLKNGSVKQLIDKLYQDITVNGVLNSHEEQLKIFKETPVFDGQYSNQCYQDRISEAFDHFKSQIPQSTSNYETLVNTWKRLIFHLPYAFHAKRMFAEIYTKELAQTGQVAALETETGFPYPRPEAFDDAAVYQKSLANFYKAVSKTQLYRAFVKEKIDKGQRASSLIGNMYTASIFLALMGTLEADWLDQNELEGSKFGFFAYGSGSKSKVFEAVIQPQWKEVVAKFYLFDRLEKRTRVDYSTYQNLHTGKFKHSVVQPSKEFALTSVGTEGVTEGARYYEWAD